MADRVLGGSAMPVWIVNADAFSPAFIPPTSETGDYTITEADNNAILEVSGVTTITFPDGLTDGFQIMIVNVGTDTITLTASTLTTKDSAVLLANQYGGASAYHAGSNVWRAFGDLS